MRYGDALQWLDEIWVEDVEQSEPARARRGDCEMGTARMSPSGRRAPKIVPRTFTWVGESPGGGAGRLYPEAAKTARQSARLEPAANAAGGKWAAARDSSGRQTARVDRARVGGEYARIDCNSVAAPKVVVIYRRVM